MRLFTCRRQKLWGFHSDFKRRPRKQRHCAPERDVTVKPKYNGDLSKMEKPENCSISKKLQAVKKVTLREAIGAEADSAIFGVYMLTQLASGDEHRATSLFQFALTSLVSFLLFLLLE